MIRSGMLRVIQIIGILSLLSAAFLLPHVAHAQPGRQVYPRSQVPPPPPPPGYGQPANYNLLSFEERRLLMDGEISLGQTIGGGALALWLGFGVGHAVQGRYGETGWKFTLGELAAVGGIMIGAIQLSAHAYDGDRNNDRGENLLIASFIAFGVIRIWEIVDTLTGPAAHNSAVRAARYKAYGPPRPRYGFFIAPTKQSDGGVAGLTLQF